MDKLNVNIVYKFLFWLICVFYNNYSIISSQTNECSIPTVECNRVIFGV